MFGWRCLTNHTTKELYTEVKAFQDKNVKNNLQFYKSVGGARNFKSKKKLLFSEEMPVNIKRIDDVNYSKVFKLIIKYWRNT